jgi:hypothetical protein
MTLNLTPAAQRNIEEVGLNPMEDVEAVQRGIYTRETLLEICLEGADEDRRAGWEEYVTEICRAAAAP